jgi:hypothetical protein
MALTRAKKYQIIIFILVTIVIVNIYRISSVRSKKSVTQEVIRQFKYPRFNSTEVNSDFDDEKIVWEDIEFVNYELTRLGPGEHGNAVEVTDPSELKKNENWLKKEGFYVEVGNSISLTRSLPEHRPDV